VTLAVVSVTTASDPSKLHRDVVLMLPTTVGVALMVWGSVRSWQRAAAQPRAFAIGEGRAFLLLPDRAPQKVVGYVLGCTFPVGNALLDARDGLGLDAWVAIVLGAILVPTALLHGVLLWRGSPRPLVEVTPQGITSRGVLGSLHAPWSALSPDYASWPTPELWFRLPVYKRRDVRRRGLHLLGVVPPRFGEPLRVRAGWATNPWWAAQALAWYWRGRPARAEIGTRDEHDRLASELRAYQHEIREEVDRFR